MYRHSLVVIIIIIILLLFCSGSVYLDDCPGRSRIPVWLIVFGVISLVSTLINVIKRVFKLIQQKASDGDEESTDYGKKTGSCLESLISVFLFVWIIIGSVWVFGFYKDYVDLDCASNVVIPECCHPVPYLFSFITLIVIYAFSFLSLCCCCCCFVCLAFIVGASSE